MIACASQLLLGLFAGARAGAGRSVAMPSSRTWVQVLVSCQGPPRAAGWLQRWCPLPCHLLAEQPAVLGFAGSAVAPLLPGGFLPGGKARLWGGNGAFSSTSAQQRECGGARQGFSLGVQILIHFAY